MRVGSALRETGRKLLADGGPPSRRQLQVSARVARDFSGGFRKSSRDRCDFRRSGVCSYVDEVPIKGGQGKILKGINRGDSCFGARKDLREASACGNYSSSACACDSDVASSFGWSPTQRRRAESEMPARETEAIILKTFPLGEADRLVSFLGRTSGRLRGVAGGARRVKNRYGSTLEILSHVQLWYVERETRDLVRIQQCELLE